MDYVKTEQGAFTVIGIGETVSNFDAESVPKIESLWQRFFADGVADQVSGGRKGAMLALYTDYQGDYTEPYLYMVGIQTPFGTNPPNGLIARDVPAQTMARIEATGPLPKSVIDVWQGVWASDLARCYVADYDIYGAEGDPVSVFVGIETARR